MADCYVRKQMLAEEKVGLQARGALIVEGLLSLSPP